MAAAKTKARIDVKYLAEQLLNCRLEAGLNQAEAAAKIGVAPSNYFCYETANAIKPTEKFISKIMQAYGKPRDFFIKIVEQEDDLNYLLPAEIKAWTKSEEAIPYILMAHAKYAADKLSEKKTE